MSYQAPLFSRAGAVRAIAAASLLCASGCDRLQARLARFRHDCPAAPPPPPVRRLTDINILQRRSRYVSGVSEIAVWTASAEPARLVLALPERGRNARQIAGDLGPYFAAGTFDVALACVDGGESYWHPRANGENRLG